MNYEEFLKNKPQLTKSFEMAIYNTLVKMGTKGISFFDITVTKDPEKVKENTK
jgi:hypothetical protein